MERMAEMKTAVVTGATQGIGLAVAELLLQKGFRVAICARSMSDLKALEQRWGQEYGKDSVLMLTADFGKKEEVLQFGDYVKQNSSQVDILVNNAGIFEPGALATEPEGQLERIMDVNLYSAYHLTRALLESMHAGSHIFNMCSVASLKAYPNGGAYSISKYALMGFSENLRDELKPKGIRVTALCPGATWSRSWSGSGVSRERVMEATDVANMVWSCYELSSKADVETIVMRPLLGDL